MYKSITHQSLNIGTKVAVTNNCSKTTEFVALVQIFDRYLLINAFDKVIVYQPLFLTFIDDTIRNWKQQMYSNFTLSQDRF